MTTFLLELSLRVLMPEASRFDTNEEYYSTLFHELSHATGHITRLNRSSVMDYNAFGSHVYSKEELIAEISTCFLCNEAQIHTTFNNSVAYIQSWSRKLKSDSNLILKAAGAAQKATDYIMNGS